MIERKNVQSKKYVLGQFFTPVDVCNQIVSNIDFSNAVIIEPSFGTGNFLRAIEGLSNEKIAIEIDPDLFVNYQNRDIKQINQNFYDFKFKTNKRIIFIGNPPYRTPAYSLTTHRSYIQKLTQKYNVPGIREEAVFFILHTIDIILQNGGNGEIHYIVPEAILKNNSKFFNRFKMFLKETCWFTNIFHISSSDFDGVSQDLVCLSLKLKSSYNGLYSLFGYNLQPSENQDTVIIDNIETNLDDYLCLRHNDFITFQQIFKRTFLGSVPCESLLMSVSGEPIEHFQARLCQIISNEHITIPELYDLLHFNNKFHLKVFENPFDSQIVQDKLNIILSYVRNIQNKDSILTDFWNGQNYKPIMGRERTQYYFRCEKIKKNKNFVYELNPNPCPSFYFTGNPSSSSTDYFGFCAYDCNRNVSPGANRTVPLADIENNLTDFFKKWWLDNTDEPFSNIFDYMIYISKTEWYKQLKRQNKRFYFAIPNDFISVDSRTPRKKIA